MHAVAVNNNYIVVRNVHKMIGNFIIITKHATNKTNVPPNLYSQSYKQKSTVPGIRQRRDTIATMSE